KSRAVHLIKCLSCSDSGNIRAQMMLSHARGPAAPLLNETVPKALMKMAERFPDHDAVIVRHQGIRLTWSQLARNRRALRTDCFNWASNGTIVWGFGHQTVSSGLFFSTRAPGP